MQLVAIFPFKYIIYSKHLYADVKDPCKLSNSTLFNLFLGKNLYGIVLFMFIRQRGIKYISRDIKYIWEGIKCLIMRIKKNKLEKLLGVSNM